MKRMLDKIEISYEKGSRKVRCFCGKTCNITIVPHMREAHPKEWEEWCQDFVSLRNKGLRASTIIKHYKADGKLLFTSSVVEREIRRMVEEQKAELKIVRKPEISEWQPSSFRLERTTVWNFPKRGEWAVHNNNYQGNWPPRVPRNLILKYTVEGDTVIDPFVGGGTTLIEAWLNDRRSLGIDISPIAIKTTQERIKEMEDEAEKNETRQLKPEFRPIVVEDDARNVKEILSRYNLDDRSVKLVCMHPPYLNSLRYTSAIKEDLSRISDKDVFCDQLGIVVGQICDLMHDDGTCAVLIGDVKKNRKVVRLGFFVMERFEQEGFQLKDIIIKTQHKDASTRFWYTKKEKLDYLMAHEYLFIFSKK